LPKLKELIVSLGVLCLSLPLAAQNAKEPKANKYCLNPYNSKANKWCQPPKPTWASWMNKGKLKYLYREGSQLKKMHDEALASVNSPELSNLNLKSKTVVKEISGLPLGVHPVVVVPSDLELTDQLRERVASRLDVIMRSAQGFYFKKTKLFFPLYPAVIRKSTRTLAEWQEIRSKADYSNYQDGESLYYDELWKEFDVRILIDNRIVPVVGLYMGERKSVGINFDVVPAANRQMVTVPPLTVGIDCDEAKFDEGRVCNMAKGVAIHELGHAFGLLNSCDVYDQEDCETSVMHNEFDPKRMRFLPQDIAILKKEPLLNLDKNNPDEVASRSSREERKGK